MRELLILPTDKGFGVHEVITTGDGWDDWEISAELFVGESREDCESFIRKIEGR